VVRLAAAGATNARRQRSHARTTLLEAARAGRATGLVPESIARAQPWPGLAFVEVTDIPPSSIAIAWRAPGAQRDDDATASPRKSGVMAQAGQVFELRRRGPHGHALWAYRYRPGGRDSKRVQRGGFHSKSEARAALDRALERARREQRRPTRQVTLAELVDEHLTQHEVEPGTTEQLRWLLSKAVGAFGEQRVDELQPAAKPAQHRVRIKPPRRVYDLRHTYATFALRAGLSTFDLSRYMGASLTMIDRHYGHLAHDGREHAIRLLDTHAAEHATATVDTGGRPVDTATTGRRPHLSRQPRD